jgi:hypothetical protein
LGRPGAELDFPPRFALRGLFALGAARRAHQDRRPFARYESGHTVDRYFQLTK